MRFNVPIVVAISGFCCLLLGLLCSSLIFPKLKTHLINKETSMREETKTFKSWKRNPFPFKFKIYFFNVTNPEEVQTGSNPTLKEIGPYIYDEFIQRQVLSVNEDNDTIKFIQRKTYKFSQEDSGCRSDDDVVTILNIGLVNLANKVNKVAPMFLSTVNDGLPYLFANIKNIFITNSVRNILFDGIIMSCESEEVETICQVLKSKLPPSIRLAENDRDYLISIFHHINGTVDGPYEMYRGFKSSNKGVLVSFKDQNILTEWGDDTCNTIRGTDLTLNPNLWDKPKKIEFFASDFCRSFSASFSKEVEYMELQVYSFENDELFQITDNCFCSLDEDSKLPECTPQGTMDIAPCAKSSIIISQPHFLSADRSLRKFAKGLKPNRANHGTSILIEPKSGVSLVVKTRFQMNVLLQKIPDIDLLTNVSEGIFPFIWLEKGAQVPEDIVNEIRTNFNKLKIFDYLQYFLLIAGVVLLGLSIILAMVKDKIFCTTNTVADNAQMGQFADFYNYVKQKNDQMVQVLGNKNIAKKAWKISD